MRPGRGAGAVLEAEVIDLDHEGRGVVRVEGRTVFVSGALPGERVRLRTVGRHRSFDEAVVDELLSTAADRVEPACPHFGVCGGCALQHLAAPAQVAFKQGQLLQTLARIGGVAPQQVLSPLTGPVWAYRRRARLGVKYVTKKERVLVGFRERAAPYVADLRECRILAAPIGGLLPELSALIASLSIARRIPQIEVAAGDDAAALVLRVLDAPSDADRERLASFEREHGLRLYLQPAGPASVQALTPSNDSLCYALPAHGVDFHFKPGDFVQVNAAMNRQMVDLALELLEVEAGLSVLDLFCGLGNFSLPIARRGAEVVGVEGEALLVERAAGNARRNGLDGVSFVTANLFEDNSAAPWARRRYDRVLLDPPRAGAREALPIIAASAARRVVYISCHPGSLARDAGLLVKEHGFALRAAGVMDMFPHTAHVEAVALFER